MKNGFSRRSFLKGFSAASLVAGGGGCASILASRSPGSLLCHACIGTANMAGYDMDQFLANPRVKVVALCDVDAEFLAEASKKAPDARVYRDWRELLAVEGDRRMLTEADDVIFVPRADPLLMPIPETVPLQLFAYYVAKANGCDVDKPKNLAKSVTVE